MQLFKALKLQKNRTIYNSNANQGLNLQCKNDRIKSANSLTFKNLS